MRRNIFALAATGALTLAAFAAPVVAGQDSAAVAATVQANIDSDICYEAVMGVCLITWSLEGHGVGSDVTLTYLGDDIFQNTGQNGKWTEVEDLSNGDYCLDLVGSVSAGFRVNEESCNGRSAELWWIVSGVQGAETQMINQYGTTLLGHDACLWDAEGSANNVEVVDCVASQPPQQLWSWAANSGMGSD